MSHSHEPARPKAALHRLRRSLLVSALLCAACSQDSNRGAGSGPETDRSHINPTGDAPSSGSNSDACRDAATTLLPAGDAWQPIALAVDDSYLYFEQNTSIDKQRGIYRMPKTGGQPEWLGGGGPNIMDMLVLDGDYVYFGEGGLHRIARSGSDKSELLSDEAVVSVLARDDEYIYFVREDGRSNPEDHLSRFNKSTGAVDDVVSAASIEAISVAGGFVYWVGLMHDVEGQGSLLEKPYRLFRTPRDGGQTVTLFEAQADLKGPNPAIIPERPLLVTDTDVYFNSMTTLDYDSSGIYRISKTAEMGTPTKVVAHDGLGDAFLRGTTLITNAVTAIISVDLTSGEATPVGCKAPMRGVLLMTHDDDTIYYMRNTADQQPVLQSIPIPHS